MKIKKKKLKIQMYVLESSLEEKTHKIIDIFFNYLNSPYYHIWIAVACRDDPHSVV